MSLCTGNMGPIPSKILISVFFIFIIVISASNTTYVLTPKNKYTFCVCQFLILL